MLNYISALANGSTIFEVVAVLVPALVLLWIVLTVTSLHKRDARFWSLGSTWTSVIACPIADHHVAELLEPVARPERAPLPRPDHSRSDPLCRRVRLLDFL